MNIRIKELMYYSIAQTFVQTLPITYFGLFVAGIEDMHVRTPDGAAFDVTDGTLVLFPPGTVLDFRFNSSRCNYFALCDIEGMSGNRLAFCNGLELAYYVKLNGKRLNLIHDQFERAEKLANSSIQRNRKAAELLLCGILAEFVKLSETVTPRIPEPLLLLKQKIDADSGFQSDIAELMEEIPGSAGHLRRLFREHYRIGIAEYRAGYRLKMIKTWMLDHKLNMKEIADLAGMKNVTHLHKFIRTHCGMTPGELRHSLGR